MRRAITVVGYALISIGGLTAIIDWLGRWDWVKGFLTTHPRFGAFAQTPLASVFLIILGFLALRAERQLDRPRIAAKFINCRMIPDLRTTPMRAVFETQEKTPGWDKTKLDWECFIEVQLANDSSTPTTIEAIEANATIDDDGHKEFRKLTNLPDGFENYTMDMAVDSEGNHHNRSYAVRYQPVPSLIDAIRKVPLTKGIGHHGWLRFKLDAVSQKAVNNKHVNIDIWLVDALDGKHRLEYKKGEDRNWDNSFLIMRDFRLTRL